MLSFDWIEFCNDITLNAVLLQIFYKYKGTLKEGRFLARDILSRVCIFSRCLQRFLI